MKVRCVSVLLIKVLQPRFGYQNEVDPQTEYLATPFAASQMLGWPSKSVTYGTTPGDTPSPLSCCVQALIFVVQQPLLK